MTQICDQPECKEPATHSYTWEWGESGVCCAKHQFTLQQTAQNIGRSITFAAISPGASPPLQREERVRLKAEALVLSEELGEAKARGLDLYRQNGLLTQQVQSLTVRGRESDAQLADALAKAAAADERLQKLEVENAELSNELSRLRVLVELPAVESRTSRGLGPQGPDPSTL